MKKPFRRKKKTKTYLRRACIILLAGYFAFALLLFAVVEITAYFTGGKFAELAVFLFLAFLVCGSLITAFVILPEIKVRQAKINLKNHDFSPYDDAEEEKFFAEIPFARYYFEPSPFDAEEFIILHGDGELKNYLNQFVSSPGRLLGMENLKSKWDFDAFYISDWSLAEKNNSIYSAEKKFEGEALCVTLSCRDEVIFKEDGVLAQGKFFPYSETEAMFVCGFVNGYGVIAKIVLHISCEMAASFALGTRIASVFRRYNIKTENAEQMNFVLADPEGAFIKVARSGKLKIGAKRKTEN